MDFGDDSPFMDTQLDIFDEYMGGGSTSNNELPSNCLDCNGEITSSILNKDIRHGGLLNNEIKHLFSKPDNHQNIIENLETLKIFDYEFDPGIAMLNNLNILMQMARKEFLRLESDSIRIDITMMRENKDTNYYNIRQNLSYLFSYLRSSLLGLPGNNDYKWLIKDITKSLYPILKDWRLLIQGLTSLTRSFISNAPAKNGNKSTNASYHLFHCYLESRWYHLTTLYAIFICDPNNYEFRQELLTTIELFMSELLLLAETKFLNTYDKERFFQYTPFPCNCVREIWLLLQLFINKLDQINTDINCSFWNIMDKLLKNYTRKSTNNKETVLEDCSKIKWPNLGSDDRIDKSWLCVWLFYHLTKLHAYSEDGIWMYFPRNKEKYNDEAAKLLSTILKTFITSDIKESKMRIIMHILLKFPSWWHMGTSPLLILWDVFIRKINSMFLLEDNLASMIPTKASIISKSAQSFSFDIESYVNTGDEDIPDNDNSFILFLRLISLQLKNLDKETLDLLWRQFKGRIFLKIERQSLASISEIGLYHFASLLLTLSLVVDKNELDNKLLEMLGYVSHIKETDKRRVVWISYLALLLLRTKQNLNILEYTPPLLQIVEETCLKMSLHSTNEIELMKIFTEGLHDLAENCESKDLGIHSLIGKWLQRYLDLFSKNITNTSKMFDAILAVANTIDFNIDSEGRVELYKQLYEYILPYMKTQSHLSDCPAQKIADLAFTLTLAAVKDEDFESLFNHFVCHEGVNVRVTCRYLCNLLPNENAMNRLVRRLSNYQNFIIQAWIKCCLLSFGNRAEINQLTNSVSKLPQLVTLCGGSTESLLDSLDPMEALTQLLDHRLKLMERIEEKQILKAQTLSCFGRIDKIAETVKNCQSFNSDGILRLYQSFGNLIKVCAPLLYTKSAAQCVLKGVISKLLLPMQIYGLEYKLPNAIDTALRQTIHLYLQGISRLHPKFDPFITRTIREIVTHYVARLAPSDRSIPHPFKVCFQENSDSTVCMLDALRISFFTKKAKILCPGSIQALQLLQSLILDNDENDWLIKEMSRILLESLLNQMLWLEEKSNEKNLVSHVIKDMLNTTAFRQSNDMQEIFNETIIKLLGNMSFHSALLFRVFMWLANMRRSLLKPSLPAIINAIENVENLRSMGRDRALRTLLGQLESQLAVSN